MKRTYIVYYDWPNTSGNHAGMAYLAKTLALEFKNVKIIEMFHFKYRYFKILNFFYAIFLALKFRLILSKGDQVFLMEYMARGCFQDVIARYMRCFKMKNKIYGLVHLSGSHLLEIYKSPKTISSKVAHLNSVIVLGSSLANFFREEIAFKNVITTFHYVDINYYAPVNLESDIYTKKISVLCIGNIKRDFYRLRNIIISLPNIHFNICQGMRNLRGVLGDLSNVTLYGFLEEDDLLDLMHQNDISLSIMEDTIGSNVITTSLAVGLVPLVSDVGSIRDYCSDKDSFLCVTDDNFVKSIEILDSDRERLLLMKKNAVKKSIDFSLDNFSSFFLNTLINE